jgi:hypothetical protein
MQPKGASAQQVSIPSLAQAIPITTFQSLQHLVAATRGTNGDRKSLRSWMEKFCVQDLNPPFRTASSMMKIPSLEGVKA